MSKPFLSRNSLPWLMCLNVLLFAELSQGIEINIDNSGLINNVGDQVSINLRISGFSSAPSSSLSGFDLTLLFNNSVLAFTSTSFIDNGTGKNQLDFPGGTLPFTGGQMMQGLGRLEVYGVSGNDGPTLDALQANAFIFATIQFQALSALPTTVSIDLSDPNLLFLDSNSDNLGVTFGSTSTTIQTGGSTVPDSDNPLVFVGTVALLLALRHLFGRHVILE
jgi:hypothetical protein